jgi:nucleoside-diphosphate-sugar epimerase
VAFVVTGAAGFIGTTLVAELRARGERVIGIDRAAQQPQPGVLALTADLLDRDALVHAALADADAVFHLAGRPGVRDEQADIEDLRERDNVAATARVLAAVPRHVPIVAASSSSVYGGTRGRASRESEPLRPAGGYARSKVRAEQLCAARLRSGGVVAVARPFTVIGEGQRPDMAVTTWLAAAREDLPLHVFGSLERQRDLTDVRDVVRVLIRLAERRACGPVNIGTGRSYRLREVVSAVAAACETQVRTVVVPTLHAEADATRADVRRLRELAGFVPRTDLYAVVARQAAHQRAPVLA